MLSRCTRGLSCILIGSAPQVVGDWKGFSKSRKASASGPRSPCSPPGTARHSGHCALQSGAGTGGCSREMGHKRPGQFGAQVTLMHNDSSSSGLFWDLPRYRRVSTEEGSSAPGRASPTSLHSPRIYT